MANKKATATESAVAEMEPLPLEDLACPICLEIFAEPITLVCGHELCKDCYKGHFEKAEFRCPLCKKRLSSWARNVKGSLVNEAKWKMIQLYYPEELNQRRNGESQPLLTPAKIVLSEKGQVREEYLKIKEEYELEKQREREQEEEASKVMIAKLLEADKEEERQRKIAKDAEIAKALSVKMKSKVSPSSLHKISLRSQTTPKNKSGKKGNQNKGSSRVSASGSIKKYLSKSSHKDVFSTKTEPKRSKRLQRGCVSIVNFLHDKPSTSRCKDDNNQIVASAKKSKTDSKVHAKKSLDNSVIVDLTGNESPPLAEKLELSVDCIGCDDDDVTSDKLISSVACDLEPDLVVEKLPVEKEKCITAANKLPQKLRFSTM